MGLTKQYLRYAAGEVFGVIAGNKSNIIFLHIVGNHGKYCATGACEDVIVWDIRTGDKYFTLKGEKHEVTKLAGSPDKQHLAVGYSDGKVCVFNLQNGEKTITFSGHKSAVTALHYDHQGLRLVSGGKDTDVIVWDIVNECGLYRMKGHKGAVTQAIFLKDRNILVTSSKDTFVKFWDLDTQHCFKTLVEHRSEVYDFVLLRDDTRLVTGSADSELRVWDLTYTDQMDADLTEPMAKKSRMDTEDGDGTEEEELNLIECKKQGSVMRSGRDRLISMATDLQQTTLICHGNDRMLEVFKLPGADELKKKLAKRHKKEKKKAGESADDTSISVELKLEDEISKVTAVKMASKISSADLIHSGKNTVKVLTLFNNNTFGFCTVDTNDQKNPATGMGLISHYGHQSDVRTISFSSDNTALMSASAESVKVWNRSSLQCIRTMPCDYALCSMFAPGDRHIILGTKSGKLQIFDIGSGSMLEQVEAHSGSLWSICMSPDKRGIVSGGADKLVKFWNFELVADEQNPESSKQLTLQHVRTLQMDEDVLCVKCSPDQRLLAVSLLDSTVKVFFMDTLKFFLSLYGHKLPVLCMDISADSTLLVSGSADRNVKIWGLDFGDCHKSIFAHDDSIMCIQFIAKTHMFFTGGKDRKIKQWDADNFEHIVTLESHHAEVWCLSVSPSGNILATGSHDKSLRLWQKTHEPLVLQEEREMEREKEFEDSVGQGGEAVVPGETNTETGLAGKKSVETVKAAERIMEAIELYREEKYKWSIYRLECQQSKKQKREPEPHPLMVAFSVNTPEKYVQTVIKKVKSSELEEALLVLPFQYVIDLLKLLDEFITNGWDIELNCRCLFFLLRVHHGQITACQELLPVVDRLRKITVEKLTTLRDRVGFNLTGLQFLQRDIEQSEETMFFMDATDRFKEKKKKKKKKAILTIKT
ncbi:WD repeat-containing protein 3-like [Mercenaria mercenaria]|uniref:WD repeat-containing protein 3-like n=1 Tax=Mercenaria mercenaria TaxID=6596 RepID=UPI00234E9A2A|nr:WD repeat-containing protein 3-like [Mercenaria mercenaria]XP_053396136.1 WD repeat-containing protein 3-like [Mercenaria mercenaria]XP_053396137.1 WD repeat-containing protein 3-like [Mercenaria mercenaria]XP_053396138.1 WD repeat-containing protein 3-like [Mercenaria mercenaria]